jgi:hypothetical protein
VSAESPFRNASSYLHLFSDNRLTIYYSDWRDSTHVEKVSQQSTADIYGTWGSSIDATVPQVSTDSNGKPSVAKV